MCHTQTLSFSYNQIGDAGATALAEACACGALPQCRELGLSRNQIGDAGITALAQAIKPASEGGMGALASLKQLWVGNEHMGHPGLVAACQPRGIEIR